MVNEYTEITKKLLYEMTENHGNENIVFSPYSVANLLAMSAEAAAGSTRDETVQALLPNETYGELSSMMSDLISKISKESGVCTANAALVKKEISTGIVDGFAESLNEKYGGELIVADDLIANANKWADKKTDGQIPTIMDESVIDALACLINVITFKGEWVDEYKESDIKENRVFSNADGTESYVTMLTSSEDNYIENEYFAGFTKQYKNGFTYMALLPMEKGQAFLQKAVTDADFAELYNSRTKREVTVNIPEYSCEFEDNLKQMLGNMGVKELFTDSADLSNMSSKPLKMDAVMHKAKIEVNRCGTRAAAATAGEQLAGAEPNFDQIKEVILDRPFVYAIIHDDTGIPLFVGTVNRLPNEKKYHLDSEMFIHPSDRAAMKALQAIPGFSQVMKAFMKIWNEKTAKIINMSSYLKLSEHQMKKYYDMLPPICKKLGIDIPEIYVKLDVNPNAYTWGDTNPYIVLTSGLFETLPNELIPSVIAHECGHIVCHHPLYTTMGNVIMNGANFFTSGLGNVALYPIQLAFAYWMRCSELSADRAAAVCDGTSDKVVETMMCFAGYDKDIMAEANVEEFMNQAKDYRQMVNTSVWNKTLEFIMFNGREHPLNAVRALEAHEWGQSDRFQVVQAYLKDFDSTQLPVRLQPKKYIGQNAQKIDADLFRLDIYDVKLVRSTETDKKVKSGDVIAVSIDGNSDCDDDFYLRDARIVLTYYEPKTAEEIAKEHPSEIRMKESSKYYIGKPYNFAENAFKALGFTNVELKEMAIPRMGFLVKPDTVAKIVVDGADRFEKDSWYAPEAKITIYYYVKI